MAGFDNEREYLVDEMLSILQDRKSEGFDRHLAARVPRDVIFQALSLVKRAVDEGKIRKSRGALFVAIVNPACADRGIPIALGQPQIRQPLMRRRQSNLRPSATLIMLD